MAAPEKYYLWSSALSFSTIIVYVGELFFVNSSYFRFEEEHRVKNEPQHPQTIIINRQPLFVWGERLT